MLRGKKGAHVVIYRMESIQAHSEMLSVLKVSAQMGPAINPICVYNSLKIVSVTNFYMCRSYSYLYDWMNT